jgi:hypothetical protein
VPSSSCFTLASAAAAAAGGTVGVVGTGAVAAVVVVVEADFDDACPEPELQPAAVTARISARPANHGVRLMPSGNGTRMIVLKASHHESVKSPDVHTLDRDRSGTEVP